MTASHIKLLQEAFDERKRVIEKAVAAERERCVEEVLKCADRALVSWNAAQEIAAAIRKGEP